MKSRHVIVEVGSLRRSPGELWPPAWSASEIGGVALRLKEPLRIEALERALLEAGLGRDLASLRVGPLFPGGAFFIALLKSEPGAQLLLANHLAARFEIQARREGQPREGLAQALEAWELEQACPSPKRARREGPWSL